MNNNNIVDYLLSYFSEKEIDVSFSHISCFIGLIELSKSYGMVDDLGKCYIQLSRTSLADSLNVSVTFLQSALKLFSQIDLIYEVSMVKDFKPVSKRNSIYVTNKPNRLYVKEFEKLCLL